MRKRKNRPGNKHINVNVVFYIKIDGGITRKSILAADGHTRAPPSSITYSSVVSMYSKWVLGLYILFKSIIGGYQFLGT